MNITLRDYQADVVQQIRQAYRDGCRAPLLQLSTGGGKTAVYCHLAEKAMAKGKNILILVHRRELLLQNSDMLDIMNVPHGLIAPGFTRNGSRVQVGSVQTVRNRLDQIAKPDLIIVDECFVAGTLVDGRPIETLKVGDYVTSYNHKTNSLEKKKIIRTFVTNRDGHNWDTVSLETQFFGLKITCTSNHPIFDLHENKYMPAYTLACHAVAICDKYGLFHYDYVHRVDTLKDNNETVYNLEVEDNNNYFANRILVHNCHHTSAGSWDKIISHYPSSLLLGVTATPVRMDGQGLGKESGGYYDRLISGPSMKELIAQGYLSQPRIFAPPNNIDHKKFHIKYGDYDKHEVEAIMDNPKIVGDVIAHYKKYSYGKPAIAFCVSIKAAEELAKRFNEAGIPSECIHGNCDNARRKYCISGLGDGRIWVLTSCEIISEGIDVPIVSTAILIRPTKSTGLYLQQVGRVLRPYKGKEYSIILDHVGNTYLHGVPEMDREWTLEGSDKLERKKGESKTFWQCKYCYAINDLRHFTCVACGEEREKADRLIPEIDGELMELERERLQENYDRQVRFDRMKERSQAKTLEELEELAKRKGYKPGWARFVYNARLAKQAGK